ncbi:MAG: M23 family metallopeptidase [Thermoanaerobaculia bacterium]|nr:M23 family metallopeptidase [Thermoanaerobaculia bacterium]
MNNRARRTLEAAILCLLALGLSGCAVTSGAISSLRRDDLDTQPPARAALPLEYIELDQDITELQAMLRRDWAANSRRSEEASQAVPAVFPRPSVTEEPEAMPRRLEVLSTADGLLARIEMPVFGVRPEELANTFGAPRDGGRRRHRGIDIFAPRGTPAIAASDGVVSFIGTQSKAGKCVWLVNDSGLSFFYAHLDRFAAGLFEGQQVRAGDVLGYVGRTGNARKSGHHLHFAIHRESQALNPYPYLVNSMRVARAEPELGGGFVAAGAQ